MIQEVIVTTRSAQGVPHIAPMGISRRDDYYLVKPFKPSRTLDNLLNSGAAVINCPDDVRVYAGCLSGRHDWPLTNADKIDAPRLAESLAHTELVLELVEDDPVRPSLLCRPVHQATHAPFQGFNRAQAAVLELAILVSRLHMLPAEKIDAEIGYLHIAIEKTAGERERQGWDWLMQRVTEFRAGGATKP